MLHTNVIDNSGFRALSDQELEAVGGGYYHEDPLPGGDGTTGGFQPPQIAYFAATGIWVDNPVIAEALLSNVGGTGFEGGDDTEYVGEIIVTPDIQDYQHGTGTFYAHLHKNGDYTQFEKIDGKWSVVAWGTWQVTMPGLTLEGGIFSGVGGSITGPGYTFTPTGSIYD